jgi:hypothetical protein
LVVNAGGYVSNFAGAESFAKFREPFGDYYLAQRGPPCLIYEALGTLPSFIMLDQIALCAFCRGTFHDGANGMPGGSEENVAVRNVRIIGARYVENSDSRIHAMPVDEGL